MYAWKTEGYDFIEFDSSNSTISTAFRQPLIVLRIRDPIPLMLFCIACSCVSSFSEPVLYKSFVLILFPQYFASSLVCRGEKSKRRRPRFTRSLWLASQRPLHSAKGGAVETGCIYMMLSTSSLYNTACLLYNTTPIHCTPVPLHPTVMNTQRDRRMALERGAHRPRHCSLRDL